MEYAYRLERFAVPARPWRIAAVALAAVAALELLVLALAGGALLVQGGELPATVRAATRAHTPAPAVVKTAVPVPAQVSGPMLPRRQVGLIVLNGSGRTGAAGAVAERAGRRGYRVNSIANAPEAPYPRSLVMYRRGFAAEGQRLARDLGVRIVGPLDGIRPSQLRGAHAVLILGG